MKRQTKLTTEQQHEHAAELHTHSQSAQEFATVEEMLRRDAAQTVVPPEIEQRLQKSARDLPAPKASWWKRWFGGTSL